MSAAERFSHKLEWTRRWFPEFAAEFFRINNMVEGVLKLQCFDFELLSRQVAVGNKAELEFLT